MLVLLLCLFTICGSVVANQDERLPNKCEGEIFLTVFLHGLHSIMCEKLCIFVTFKASPFITLCDVIVAPIHVSVRTFRKCHCRGITFSLAR